MLTYNLERFDKTPTIRRDLAGRNIDHLKNLCLKREKGEVNHNIADIGNAKVEGMSEGSF